MTGTVQIAIPSEYSQILSPYSSYIPLHLDQMFDVSLIEEINWWKARDSTFDAVLSEKRLRSENLVDEILKEIVSLQPLDSSGKTIQVNQIRIRVELAFHSAIQRGLRALFTTGVRLLEKSSVGRRLLIMVRSSRSSI